MFILRGVLTVATLLPECAPMRGLKRRNEYCGIAGFISTFNVSQILYFSLRALQHRGQESAGIATYYDGDLLLFKGMGLVHEVFNREILNFLQGNVGIGHVRYSTTGGS